MPGVAVVAPAQASLPAADCADAGIARRALTLSAQFAAVGRRWLQSSRAKHSATPTRPPSKHQKLVLAKISNPILSSSSVSSSMYFNGRRSPTPEPAFLQHTDELSDLVLADPAMITLQIELGCDGIPSYLDVATASPEVVSKDLPHHGRHLGMVERRMASTNQLKVRISENTDEHVALMIQALRVASYDKLREPNLPMQRKVVIAAFVTNKLNCSIN
ncbi:hypothetical protein HDU83_004533 [Entophlyctis luteolus]|nr:hypothetical protein HDU83_004533 [Entophlyctis luteolus]